MKIFSKILSVFLFGTLILLNFSCKPDENGGDSPEKQQLDKLKKTWNLQTATLEGDVRTDFTNVTLTFGGEYQDKGTYTYSLAGTLPTPTNPWPKEGGKWKFGNDVATSMIRLDSQISSDDADLPMTYSIANGELTISFNYTGEGFAGGLAGRTSEVEGNWVFIFK